MRLVAFRHPVLAAVAASLLGSLTAASGLGVLGAPATAAPAGAAHAGASDHPHGPTLLPRAHDRLVDHATHGSRAVRALGGRLDDAAERNGMSATRLRSLLEQDHTSWVDPTGRLYFKEAPVPAAVASGSASTTTSQPSQATVSDVFALHSRPVSTHTIYLNFVGMYVGGTAWNSAGVPAGTYRGFSLDSDYTAFTSTERAAIQEIWERVSAAYAPFDVDVTTQAPADSSAFTRSDLTDTTYGTQVLIDSDSTDPTTVCGSDCAGVAYMNTFAQDRSGSYQPAWVFPAGAGGSIAYIAQSAEHEVGHTFGLVHDGIVTNGSFDPYYGGNGLWGPIMGGGRPEAVYQFSNGDYPNAQTQGTQSTPDDLALIAQSAPLLSDDAGNSTVTAADLGAATSYSRTGLISTRSDVDVFRISRTCTGTFSVSAKPTVQNSPLDLSLSVVDAAGNAVASADPASSTNGDYNEPLSSGMGASVAPSLGAGTYYVSIDGVGNPSTSRGYSDYGSVGAYQLTASGCASTTTTTGTTGDTTGTTGTTTTGTTGSTGGSGTTTTSGSTGGSGTTTTSGSTGGSGTTTTTGTSGTGGTTDPSGPTTPGASFRPLPAPLSVGVDRLRRTLDVSWWSVDVVPAGTRLLDWHLQLRDSDTGAVVGRTVSPDTHQQSFGRLATGHWTVSVRSEYSDGSGATAATSAVMAAPMRAGLARAVHAHRGARGGRSTVRATWWAPASSGSYPVTGYQVQVLHLSASGARTVSRHVVARGASARAVTVRVSRHGSYAFRVRALTAAGPSAWSARSSVVRGR